MSNLFSFILHTPLLYLRICVCVCVVYVKVCVCVWFKETMRNKTYIYWIKMNNQKTKQHTQQIRIYRRKTAPHAILYQLLYYYPLFIIIFCILLANTTTATNYDTGVSLFIPRHIGEKTFALNQSGITNG